MSEPAEVVEMRAQVARARGLYRATVEAEVAALLELAEPFGLAIGEVCGVSEALDAWREAAISALAQRYRREEA